MHDAMDVGLIVPEVVQERVKRRMHDLELSGRELQAVRDLIGADRAHFACHATRVKVAADPRQGLPQRRYPPAVIASRHYTVEQANAALEWVVERIERLRAAREGLNDDEARAALGDAAPANGGGAPGRVVSEAFLEMRSALVELQEMEVVLRDLDRGLIDFPSIRDGEEVFLCWEEGEDEIGYWHELDAGYGGRRPL